MYDSNLLSLPQNAQDTEIALASPNIVGKEKWGGTVRVKPDLKSADCAAGKGQIGSNFPILPAHFMQLKCFLAQKPKRSQFTI
ncbi:hypothetical protein G113_04236 [Aeromonas molluscorum 848]|uniref:Uncharacterized protein n=1 Tax=Aeromonas molluscorum 848 TaxID=1268236 RepID=R1HD66_9GAMM|nr:hypothetical protein G113_04236 [Aeromonas molluscorum 848]